MKWISYFCKNYYSIQCLYDVIYMSGGAMSYLTGITSDWLLRDSNLFFIKIVDIYVYNRRYIFVDVHMCVCAYTYWFWKMVGATTLQMLAGYPHVLRPGNLNFMRQLYVLCLDCDFFVWPHCVFFYVWAHMKALWSTYPYWSWHLRVDLKL